MFFSPFQWTTTIHPSLSLVFYRTSHLACCGPAALKLADLVILINIFTSHRSRTFRKTVSICVHFICTEPHAKELNRIFIALRVAQMLFLAIFVA